YIEGTKQNPITLTAMEPIGNHKIIKTKLECEYFVMKHVSVINGLVSSYQTDNHFQNVIFNNDQLLEWNYAVVRTWFGKLLIEDCIINGINQGEGVLVHNCQNAVVRNCEFNKVPDAVEYLNCKNSSIYNNVFNDMNDDGIDLNNCHQVSIYNNEFYNVGDRGLEIGSENMGSSGALSIYNNLFSGCNIAINVKESSNAVVENITFYDNNVNIELITPNDSTRISNLQISKSIFVGDNANIDRDMRSELSIINCSSEVELGFSNTNTVGPILLSDPDNSDYTLQSATLPEGLLLQEIGYWKQ
ncbi:MAG: right-handed parallel beta-helix repeat-containing protein, partial [Saprospiraceae bacterium]